MFTSRRRPKRPEEARTVVLFGAEGVGKTTLAKICIESARTPIDIISSPALAILVARPTIIDTNPCSPNDIQKLADMHLLSPGTMSVHLTRKGFTTRNLDEIENMCMLLGVHRTTLSLDDLDQAALRLLQMLGVSD